MQNGFRFLTALERSEVAQQLADCDGDVEMRREVFARAHELAAQHEIDAAARVLPKSLLDHYRTAILIATDPELILNDLRGELARENPPAIAP